MKAEIVDSIAPNPKFYGNNRTLEFSFTSRLGIQVKIDDKAVICQVKHIMYVESYFILALCRRYSWNISFFPL